MFLQTGMIGSACNVEKRQQGMHLCCNFEEDHVDSLGLCAEWWIQEDTIEVCRWKPKKRSDD